MRNTGGRAWVYGDGVDTDLLAPSAYLMQPPEQAVEHCLENLDPDFASGVREGDVFVAGENLGVGSSREQAPYNLQRLGIRAVVARSFARIFYRNVLNLGLVAVVCPDAGRIRMGDDLSVDAVAGRIVNHTTGETLDCEPLPEHLMAMIRDGGLIPHLKKRLAR